MPPHPSTPPCVRLAGHNGPHSNDTNRTGDDTCETCGTTEGPHATVTDETTGTVRHRLICRQCATGGSPQGARQSVRMCARCGTVTTRPVLVSEVHQASGPGFSVYACPACAVHYPPSPEAFPLLPAVQRSEERTR